MKGLVHLGIKNLMRYKRRSLITAAAVSMGLMMYIIVNSILIGAARDSEINIIRYEAAHGKVVSSEYWKDFEDYPIKEVLSLDVQKRLEESSLTWAPRIDFPGDLVFRKNPYPEDGSIKAVVTAIDPQMDSEVLFLEQTLSSGHYLKPGEEGVMLGSWLAEDFGIELGYPLDILVHSRFGGMEVMELEVVGILDTPNPAVTRYGVIIPLSLADDYLEMDGQVTEALIRFSDIPSVRLRQEEELRTLLQGTGAEFHDWGEWAADFLAIAEGKQNATGSILFLLLLIAAVGISNTVLMSIFERVRELGMMRAMGMTDRDIRSMFLVESGGIGLMGGLMGLAMGSFVNIFLVRNGIDYSFMLRDLDAGYRITGIFYGFWNPVTLISSVFIGVAMCVLISWVSTRKINRLEITACLRFE